jgi:ketosteroid isomerase-like protein
MYRRFVASRIRQVFDDIGNRELERVLAGLAPDVHHAFAGEHPLAGERHSSDSVRRWFQRVFRLYPELTFDLHAVDVAGPPWRLRVAVEWTAHVVPAAGGSYDNRGAHVIEIARGKVSHLHAYEDSQAVAESCAVMVAAGIDEAGAPPIVD